MIIELWGVRGSLPTPLANNEYRDRIKEILTQSVKNGITQEKDIPAFIESLDPALANTFGGNTTCVSVTSASGRIYILDMGTGLRPLGDRLIQDETFRGKGTVSFFITHTHWDHVQGFPFFKPAYFEGNEMIFHSPLRDLEDRMKYQQDVRFFPRHFDEMPSKRTFVKLDILKEFEPEPGLIIDCLPLKHPGGSYAYRFRENGKTFIFATDVEFSGEYLENITPEHLAFFKDADLLIIDSQYTLDDAFTKFDWGHTSYTMAVNCGLRWNVQDLVLTHHEPSYNDKRISDFYLETLEHRNQMDSTKPVLHLATEGTRFKL